MTEYQKPFLVNVEGPDDIEEFDTMREAAERANEINADLVETISRGGEFAPHLWAVPWRTATYLAQFRDPEGRAIGAAIAADMTRSATDVMVERFKAEWHRADAEGDSGNRVRRALTAAISGAEG